MPWSLLRASFPFDCLFGSRCCTCTSKGGRVACSSFLAIGIRCGGSALCGSVKLLGASGKSGGGWLLAGAEVLGVWLVVSVM